MRLGSGAVSVFAGATLLAAGPVHAQAPVPAANVERIRQQLDTPSPVRDAAEAMEPPTFRVSVSEERLDIGRFWGAPDAVSPIVRPPGGPWHYEYLQMVTPDEFKGYGAIFTNREKAALATQAMASALMWKYLPGAIATTVKAAKNSAARAEVREALEEFYVTHPWTRPAPAAQTPP